MSKERGYGPCTSCHIVWISVFVIIIENNASLEVKCATDCAGQWTIYTVLLDFTIKQIIDPNSILFLEIPDAPLEIQVEPGPRQGTLLVMWLPVKPDGKPPNSIVNGYSVYVDGRKVKEMLSPTGTMSNLLITI